jgi:excisionase family DNA binding protein
MNMTRSGDGHDYLRAGEVADLLHVSPKTVGRWAREGRLSHVATLGGHRRYARMDIERLAASLLVAPPASPTSL